MLLLISAYINFVAIDLCTAFSTSCGTHFMANSTDCFLSVLQRHLNVPAADDPTLSMNDAS